MYRIKYTNNLKCQHWLFWFVSRFLFFDGGRKKNENAHNRDITY